jgi:hypothetical protein
VTRKKQDDSYILFKTSVIPEVTEVRVYSETLDHVQENHPELGGIFPQLPMATSGVGVAYVDPTHVENPRPGAYVFVDATSTNAEGDPLRAPVKVIENTSALAKTFYFAETTGNANIVWRKDEDA